MLRSSENYSPIRACHTCSPLHFLTSGTHIRGRMHYAKLRVPSSGPVPYCQTLTSSPRIFISFWLKVLVHSSRTPSMSSRLHSIEPVVCPYVYHDTVHMLPTNNWCPALGNAKCSTIHQKSVGFLRILAFGRKPFSTLFPCLFWNSVCKAASSCALPSSLEGGSGSKIYRTHISSL